MSAPSAPQDEPRLAADAAAADLVQHANVAAPARHAANAAGDGFFARLMAHELVINHRLVMLFGAMADSHLDFTSPTIDADCRQVGRDSVQYAALAARLSERVRQATLALATLAPDDAESGPTTYPFRHAYECDSCGKLFYYRPRAAGGNDDSAGGSGLAGGGPATSPGSAPPHACDGNGSSALSPASTCGKATSLLNPPPLAGAG